MKDKKYKKYQDYFKFSIVRNPWDSFVSAYFSIKQEKHPQLFKLFNKTNDK
jgi:hypothetical protein